MTWVPVQPTEPPHFGTPSAEGCASGAAELGARISAALHRIERAADRVGRPAGAVQILLATKTQDASTVRAAYEAAIDLGIRAPRLGENRSGEGREKAAALDLPGAAWSMIGHLQSNKVDAALAFASEIQSLDRMSLAVALDKRLQRAGRSVDVLVQLKTAHESSKFGLAAPDVPMFLRDLTCLPTLNVRGFMTLATNTRDADEIRRCFRLLRAVHERARQESLQAESLTELSMGMSSDFELAVEEGATCVRLGEAVFGKRSFRPPGGWWAE